MAGLFRGKFKNKELEEAEVDGYAKPLLQERSPVNPSQLCVGSGQSAGRERSHNEDTLFVFNTVIAGNEAPLSVGIFIVADGMGGHQGGEIASGLAVRAAVDHLMTEVYLPLLNSDKQVDKIDFEKVMKGAVDEAQKLVIESVPGGGTTFTAALVLNEQVHFAHVGDSRLYLFSPDSTVRVWTRDHSLVRRLVDLGQLTEEEAAVHPQRNILYRALGQTEAFEADLDSFQMKHGSVMMICSDGLWGLLYDDAMFDIISSHTSAMGACKELVEAANNAGGPDNISVILVAFP
ncbi:MAG: protein phosphatase 2C domain-containing protein [Chloroflexota bacterium]